MPILDKVLDLFGLEFEEEEVNETEENTTNEQYAQDNSRSMNSRVKPSECAKVSKLSKRLYILSLAGTREYKCCFAIKCLLSCRHGYSTFNVISS